MEDGAGTGKGAICPNHLYPMPWVALGTKDWLDSQADSRPAARQATDPKKGDGE